MQIRIPSVLIRIIAKPDAWMNTPVYPRLRGGRGRIDVRRFDVVLALFGVVLAGYYWETGGWQSMIHGLGFYVFCIIVALLFRPSNG
jgi:hypothetical protein